MPPSPKGGGPPPPPPPTTMVIPILTSTTITVDTTLVRTVFITTTTIPSRPTSTSCVSESSGCSGILPPASSGSGVTSLPFIASQTSSRPGSSTTTSQAAQHASTLGSSPTAHRKSDLTTGQKHAIIGGLSSAIAGLVFIGVLVALFLRRRQKRKDENAEANEKGLRQSISRTWSQVTSTRTVPRPTPPLSRQSSTAEVNGSVIRMSLGGFPRPFAHHKSWRESMGAGKLMVMNPDDASETNTTPGQRPSVESSNTLFSRPRNRPSIASTAFMRRSLSRASSKAPAQDAPPPVPTISIDPALSSEDISHPQSSAAPSFRSYQSSPSSRTIQQRAPEDPFLTPPDERLEEAAISPSPKAPRPGLAVLQNAAGSATRTLSNLSQALNPFRNRANSNADHDDDGTASRLSSLTFSSNGDPFKLDRRSMTDTSSVWPDRSPQRAAPVHIPYDRMYEGT